MNSFKKKSIVWIFFLTLLKIIIASSIALGNDEVYYRFYAENLNWSYFDHPPMVGWLIDLFTLNNKYLSDINIRMAAIVCGIFTSWIIFLCGKKIKDEKTGFIALMLYSCTTYGFLITGTFILPDSPQMLFWSLAVYFSLDFLFSENPEKKMKSSILLFGLFSGLAMLSKIHSVFLWVGLFLYLLINNKKLLRSTWIYLSLLIMMLLFSPVLYWNIKESFITYTYHSSRVDVHSRGIRFDTATTFILAQLFYANIIAFPLCIYALIQYFFKRKLNLCPNKVSQYFLFLSIPLISVVLFLSFFNQVLPHWIGPGFMTLALFTAHQIVENGYDVQSKWIWKIHTAWPVFITLVLTIFVNFYPGTIALSQNDDSTGRGDPTLDMYGWNDAYQQLRPVLRELKIKSQDLTLISNQWFPASHEDHYIAQKLGVRLICLGDLNRIHEYHFLNQKRGMLNLGDTAFCIIPSNYYFDINSEYGLNFRSIVLLRTFNQYRSKKMCRKFYLYRLNCYLKPKAS